MGSSVRPSTFTGKLKSRYGILEVEEENLFERMQRDQKRREYDLNLKLGKEETNGN